MAFYFCFWMTWACFLIASKRTEVSCEVQFITAEIKRNNITLPHRLVSKASNSTHGNASSKNSIDKDKSKSSKGEKKSEVYVVNNGLLLLHPKKVVTIAGVKKSTEPDPPSSINYHVIKKLKNNGTNAKTSPHLVENHLRKRSLSIRFQKGNKKIHGSKLEAAAKRLEIPVVSHGRIISVNKSNKFGKENNKIVSFFNNNKNRTHRERKHMVHSNENIKKLAGMGRVRGSSGIGQFRGWSGMDQFRGLSQVTHEQNEKRADIENPLFDSDQAEYVQLVRNSKSQKEEPGIKRTRKSQKKEASSVKDIPDIKKYLDKPIKLHEYPRFVVQPFPGMEFPRFPLSLSALSVYPRFSLSPQNTQMVHRFPVHSAPLAMYPRYPYSKPAIQFPRYEKGVKRFTEYPRFEKIKPISQEEFPRFPEPKPIPEIQEIGEAEKRGKSKRGEILHSEGYSTLKHFNGNTYLSYINNENYDEEGDDTDDDDDDDDDAYERRLETYMRQDYPFITPIGSITHIASPPGIPEIADIPFLPEIPPLHGIHGIRPISPIKSIPQSDKTGTSRSLPTEAKDIARIQSNNVSIKDLTKDSKTV